MWIGLGIRITNWWRRAIAASSGPFNNHATLTGGLISYWKLDEQSGTRYDSVTASANDLTDNNTVMAATAGPTGVVAHFTAANSESLSHVAPPVSVPGAWAFWFKLTSNAADGAYTVYTTGYESFNVYVSSGNIYALYHNYYDGTAYVTITQLGLSYPAGTWIHAYVEYDNGAGNTTIRVNDSITYTGTDVAVGPPFFNGTHEFRVGVDGADNADWDGEIARLACWSVKPTAAQVTDHYNAGNGKSYSDLTSTENLAHFWNLDEASGVRVDSVGGFNLTDNNTVTSATNVAPPPKNVAAYFTKANSEYLSNAKLDLIPHGTSFSMSLWMKETTSTTCGIIGQYGSDALNTVLVFTDAGLVYFLMRGNSSESFASFGALPAGYNHVIVTYNATTGVGTGYLNNDSGTTCFTVAAANLNQAAWSTEFRVGRYSTNYFDGVGDEIGLWSRVLTAQERSDLYNSGAGLYY